MNRKTDMNEKQEQILKLFPGSLRSLLAGSGIDFNKLNEIRMHAGGYLFVIENQKESVLTARGELISASLVPFPDSPKIFHVTAELIEDFLSLASSYSLYAFEDEISQGFLTVGGGHRIGICGKGNIDADGHFHFHDFSSINLRIAHEVKGCANDLIPFLTKNGMLQNTLILSAPGAGKTTLLRDMIRQLSNGNRYCPGKKISVLDERGEIGNAYLGIPMNDVGVRTDLYDTCPKLTGMILAARSMSPEIIAVDEIGSMEELKELSRINSCGIHILATMHASDKEDYSKKEEALYIKAKNLFQKFIFIDSRTHEYSFVNWNGKE